MVLLMVQKSVDHQLGLVVEPVIYRALYIPGGGLGILPSTVLLMGVLLDFYCPPRASRKVWKTIISCVSVC